MWDCNIRFRYTKICFILFVFIKCIKNQESEINRNFLTNESNWLNWTECEELYDFSVTDEEEICWQKRFHKCTSQTNISINISCGVNYKGKYIQELFGCFSCPSGIWTESKWPSCESKGCKTYEKTRMVYCKATDYCQMKETMMCSPYETCNGSYSDWEVIQNCTTCSNGDTKIKRKHCLYGGTLNKICKINASEDKNSIVESTKCKPSDCSRSTSLLTAKAWSNWTECFCLEGKLVHQRKCLTNCNNQKLEIESCSDECTFDSNNNCRVPCRDAVHQDCHHVFSCTLITILLIAFISFLESFIFCFFCFCRRKKKRSVRKDAHEIQHSPTDEEFLHSNVVLS